jgi:hypothetical protein
VFQRNWKPLSEKDKKPEHYEREVVIHEKIMKLN